MLKPHSVIVGGTRGIGRVLVNKLVSQGHSLSVLGRRRPEKDVPSDCRFWQVDVSDASSLLDTFSSVISWGGNISRLVLLQRYRGDAADSWHGEIATSLTATRTLIEAAKEKFSPDGEKSVVLVSSVASRLIASEQPLAYHLAKAGVEQMARYFAVVFGPLGIRVNVVVPGTVIKPENQEFYQRNTPLQEIFNSVIPLQRMGTAADVVDAIDFLGGAKATFITGQVLTVDGGVNLMAPESLAVSLVGQLGPKTK